MTETVQLKTRVIVGRKPGPRLLITGGVHGDEYEPMVAIRRLVKAVNPNDLAGTLVLCPVVNESAYHRRQRTGDDGLDLARVCPGRPDGTITQRVAHALSALIRTADFYIDLHAGGVIYSVLPMAGYMLVNDHTVLEVQRQMARAMNLTAVWGTDPLLNGRSLSVARDAGIPAIYAEYYGSSLCNPQGVEAYIDGCLNVMAALNMVDRVAPDSRIQYVVESDRPNAGVMQIQNPSPCAGYFEPAVHLGQHINKGDLLGSVSDILGDDVQQVCTQQSGLLLTLRMVPCVDEGDSLAAIMEME